MTQPPPSIDSPAAPAPSACPCQAPPHPQVVSNRPGQATISDRVEDFTGFRRALLRPLPAEQALGPWRPAPGDLGLQLLEWWAYLSDILTFYTERIANETYLRTAQFPDSIAGLVALLGYTPAPALAATGILGALRTPTHPGEPVVIPAGMPVSSTATPAVAAQSFEAAPASFPGPSDVTVALAPTTALDVHTSDTGADLGPASVLLAGTISAAKPRDQLLLVAAGWAGTDDNWAAVTVQSVTPETDPNTGAVNTRITFTPDAVWGTTPASPPLIDIPILFDRPASLFTTPAAVKVVSPATRLPALSAAALAAAGGWWRHPPTPAASPPRQAAGYRLLKPTATHALWNPPTGGTPTQAVSGQQPHLSVALSATVRSMAPGDLVYFDAGPALSSVLGVVSGTAERLGSAPFPPPASPPTPADLVIPYTELTVDSADPDTLGSYNTAGRPATVTVRHGYRDIGTVLPNPTRTLAALPAIVTAPPGTALPPGSGATTALLEDATGAGALITVAPAATTGGPPDTVALALTAAPAAPASFDPPLQPPLRLLFDLISVSRGATVTNEVLGSGNAALTNQRFTLKKSPLTYLASGAGWTPALAVYADGIRWTEVPTLYDQPPGAQVYVVQRAPDHTATIRFGDGVNGARLPTGSHNITATYRYGAGAASPPAGRLTTLTARPPNLAAIHNPVAVSGGKDPQAPAEVKTDAPASVFTFGRAISAIDYEVVAAQAAGVTRVKAYWTFDPAAARTLVKLYVNDDAGGLTTATAALAGAEDPNRPIRVAAAHRIDVALTATLLVAADRIPDDVVAAATAAVTDPSTGAFSPTRMGIGQWLYRSHLDAALSMPGVLAVHHLQVSWTHTTAPPALTITGHLDEVADPGEGGYFALSAADLTLTAVTAHG